MADREPTNPVGRLSDVNPGTLSSADHAQHDRWLVVRAASHDTDLTPAESTSARVLLEGCDECASLAADITTITQATAVSLAPARPRDFQLTPAQAATARGGVLDRLGRWLASPRASILRPLAGASLAIGIVLVAVGPSIQGPVQPPVPGPNAGIAAPAESAGAADIAAPLDTATPDPAHIMDMQLAPQGSGPVNPEVQTGLAPDASPGMAGVSAMAASQPPDATPPPDASSVTRMAKSSPGVSPDVTAEVTPDPQVADVQGVAGASPASGGSGQDAVAASSIRSPDDTTKAIVLLGIVLAGTGILILLLTWLVRRMTRDPLLPR